MVDRVYKADIPALKEELQKLRDGFSGLGTKTDWTKLRVEPLLRHAESLERQLNSEVFSREFSRLTKGVAMFHSDLVYLRTNVKELKKLLQSEKSHIRF
jgi:predicted RNase H-like nuclease (RuvC/YqgF family)